MSITRRRFVLTSLATPIAASLGGGLAAQIAAGTAPAFLRNGLGQNEKLRVLKVGVGGMGEVYLAEQQPMLARAEPYIANPKIVREIVDAGTERARVTARETMREVREAMGLNY